MNRQSDVSSQLVAVTASLLLTRGSSGGERSGGGGGGRAAPAPPRGAPAGHDEPRVNLVAREALDEAQVNLHVVRVVTLLLLGRASGVGLYWLGLLCGGLVVLVVVVVTAGVALALLVLDLRREQRLAASAKRVSELRASSSSSSSSSTSFSSSACEGVREQARAKVGERAAENAARVNADVNAAGARLLGLLRLLWEFWESGREAGVSARERGERAEQLWKLNKASVAGAAHRRSLSPAGAAIGVCTINVSVGQDKRCREQQEREPRRERSNIGGFMHQQRTWCTSAELYVPTRLQWFIRYYFVSFTPPPEDLLRRTTHGEGRRQLRRHREDDDYRNQ